MEIKIGKSARRCTSCERSFEHEEQFRSVIRPEDQLLTRYDYCVKCWDSERAADAYSAWSPKYYDPAVAEAESPETFTPLRQLFYDAVDATDRPSLAMAFLAAQLLRRQKVFRLLKETEDEDEEIKVTLFTDRIGDKLIEVRDPYLTHAEMEEGRRLLIERLAEIENPDGADADEGEADDSEADDSDTEEAIDGTREEEVSVD